MSDESPIPPFFESPEGLAEFSELIVRYLNGRVSNDELGTLNQVLSARVEARRMFVRLSRLHGLLAENAVTGRHAAARAWDLMENDANVSSVEAGLTLHDATVQPALHEDEESTDTSEFFLPSNGSRKQPANFWRQHGVRLVQIAALLLIVLTGVLIFLPSGRKADQTQIASTTTRSTSTRVAVSDDGSKSNSTAAPAPIVVKLGAAVAADIRRNDGHPLSTGDVLTEGLIDLRTGWVRIDFSTGVKVVAEAPAKFRLASGSEVVVTQGRVTAEVPTAGHGFTIAAPFCRLVDLGTEFGVAVTPTGQSDLAVFKGLVRIDGRPTPGDIATQGQAIRFTSDTAPAVPMKVVPTQFVRRNQFDRWAAAATPGASSADKARAATEQICRDPSLVLYYSFNDRGDDTTRVFNQAASTAGRYDLHLDGANAPTWSDGRLPGLSSLDFNTALEQRLVLPDYPATTTGQMTLSAWVYYRNVVGWASIAKNWSDTGGASFHFGMNGAGDNLDVQLDGASPDGPRLAEDGNNPFPMGRWVHVAFTTDGRTMKIFRDGVVVANGRSRMLPSPQSLPVKSLGIGYKTGDDGDSPSTTAPGFWDGKMSDLALFHRALTDAEVANLASVGRP